MRERTRLRTREAFCVPVVLALLVGPLASPASASDGAGADADTPTPETSASPPGESPEPPPTPTPPRVVAPPAPGNFFPGAGSVTIDVGVMAQVGFQPGIVGVSDSAASPGVSAAFAPSVVVLLPPDRTWGFFLGGAASAPTSSYSPHDFFVRAATSLHVHAGGCWLALDHPATEGVLCAGALVGTLNLKEDPGAFPPTVKPLFAGPLAAGRLWLGTNAVVRFYVGAAVFVPIARAEIVVHNGPSYSRPYFQTADVALTTELGISFRIPIKASP